jgi:hypothetical protein
MKSNGSQITKFLNIFIMKKLFAVSFLAMLLIFGSCHNKAAAPVVAPASGTASPDSAANNGILPPSASPGDATNSSLADTTYKGKDSSKVKH